MTTNPKTRESRLFSNMFEHVLRSSGAIVRSYAMFRAYTVFLLAGAFFILVGALPYLRFLWWVLTRSPQVSGHVQSLVIGGVLVLFGIVLVVLGVVADLLSVNRKLIEDVLLRLKRLEYGDGSEPDLEAALGERPLRAPRRIRP